jgi:pyruvoyl-dependent arginine decarboxylase
MSRENQSRENPWVPRKVFLTKGVGIHAERLNSFEEALRDARISPMNLVKVSSIVPPHCELVTREEGLKLLTPGQITFCVMSRCESDEAGRLLAAAVALLLPENTDDYGYISEYHGYGKKHQKLKIGSATRQPGSCLRQDLRSIGAGLVTKILNTPWKNAVFPKFVVSGRGINETWVTDIGGSLHPVNLLF